MDLAIAGSPGCLLSRSGCIEKLSDAERSVAVSDVPWSFYGAVFLRYPEGRRREVAFWKERYLFVVRSVLLYRTGGRSGNLRRYAVVLAGSDERCGENNVQRETERERC